MTELSASMIRNCRQSALCRTRGASLCGEQETGVWDFEVINITSSYHRRDVAACHRLSEWGLYWSCTTVENNRITEGRLSISLVWQARQRSQCKRTVAHRMRRRMIWITRGRKSNESLDRVGRWGKRVCLLAAACCRARRVVASLAPNVTKWKNDEAHRDYQCRISDVKGRVQYGCTPRVKLYNRVSAQ